VIVTRWLTAATAVLLSRVLCVVKGLAKLIYARVHEAIKHLVTTKQLITNPQCQYKLMSKCTTYDHKQATRVQQPDGRYV